MRNNVVSEDIIDAKVDKCMNECGRSEMFSCGVHTTESGRSLRENNGKYSILKKSESIKGKVIVTRDMNAYTGI